MNVVVTGATSFLGAAMVKRLLKLKHQVFAVVRPGSVNRSALHEAEGEPGLHVIESELSCLDEIDRLVKVPCQAFVHFGWDGSGSENRIKRDVQQKNVDDSMKALEGARKLGCTRFVFSGSQAEYGICQTAMTEELPCDPVSEYGKAKLEFGRRAANQCRIWREEDVSCMEYIHTRIFSVYGPGDHPRSLIHACLDTFLGGGHMELGACTQQWNYLYLDEAIDGMLSLVFCNMPLNGSYNIAGAEQATMALKDYVETMYEICGQSGHFTYGTLGPNAEGPANLIPDIHKLTEATGWQPKITFEEGIRRMLEIEKRCLVCGTRLPAKPLMALAGMPASAQDIPDAQGIENEKGMELRLFQCEHCGLVQFDCPPVSYYQDVIRSGGFSTTMVELRRSQYQHLIGTYHLEGKKFIEVGCGQGEFLGVLTEFPVKAYGVEHREDLVQLACGRGLNVSQGFAEKNSKTLGADAPYDVFLSFNFLEHQPFPGEMLDCISRNLTEGGMGLITVPSLEYILQYDGYYELIRDHIAYYSFETLRYLLERHGFQVLEEVLVNRDTCSVIVRKAVPSGTPSYVPVDLKGLEASRTVISEELRNLSETLKSQGETLAIWGASHQGFTLAATTCLGTEAAYIIDSAPFKQGLFAPASHLPIVAPDHYAEHPVDVILIVAPGYTKEIAKTIRSRFGSGVRMMTLRSDHLEELEEPS